MIMVMMEFLKEKNRHEKNRLAKAKSSHFQSNISQGADGNPILI